MTWRSARHRALRWPTWLWAVAAWAWMAQAVVQHDGVSGAVGQAGMGLAVNGLVEEPVAPLPAWDAQPVTLRLRVEPDEAGYIGPLSERPPRWRFMETEVRAAMDEAAAQAGGLAGWRRVIVAGTGERAGSALDWERGGLRGGGVPAGAHLVIGNGSRCPDGRVERTAVPLSGSILVVALVGDFARHEPTADQLRAVTEVVDYARAKCGVIPVEPAIDGTGPLGAAVLDAAYNTGLTARPSGTEMFR